MTLRNQVVIVTGAGQGIGRQIAVRLGQEGMNLMLTDINESGCRETAEIISKEHGARAKISVTDVRSESQVKEMVREALKIADKIDVLVNNAGIAGPVKYLEDVELNEWEETMAVNLRGIYLCCKYVLPIMKKNRFGNIINIASVTGKRPLPMRSPYAASKMGVIGFTRTLAAEVGAHNVRVNALCPGAVTGERQRLVFEGIMKYSGKTREEVLLEKTESSPLKTLVDPKYVAAAVVFLCSEEVGVITGEDLNISAGAVMY
jgi:NAD(P)-dependent dehydrogenase (short-subunit alcohol dehydrogenase family)